MRPQPQAPVPQAPLPPKESPAQVATTRTQPKARSKFITALIVAAVLHVVFGIIAGLVVILKPVGKTPNLVVEYAGTGSSLDSSSKKKTTPPKKTVASAAPIEKMMLANAQAQVSMTETEAVSVGPLGTTVSDLSSFSVEQQVQAIAQSGGATTLFGARGGDGLMGTFYDLTQTKKGNPTNNGSIFGTIVQILQSKDSISKTLDQYFQASEKLSFTHILIPRKEASVAPEIFGVADEVTNYVWCVHYSGKLLPPSSGKWRFKGTFDDAILIWINGKLVFNGGLEGSNSFTRDSPKVRQFDGALDRLGSAMTGKFEWQGVFEFQNPNGGRGATGQWFEVKEGRPFKIDILIAEGGKGWVTGMLFTEKMGEESDKQTALFSTTPITGETRRNAKNLHVPLVKDHPVFTPVK